MIWLEQDSQSVIIFWPQCVHIQVSVKGQRKLCLCSHKSCVRKKLYVFPPMSLPCPPHHCCTNGTSPTEYLHLCLFSNTHHLVPLMPHILCWCSDCHFVLKKALGIISLRYIGTLHSNVLLVGVQQLAWCALWGPTTFTTGPATSSQAARCM